MLSLLAPLSILALTSIKVVRADIPPVYVGCAQFTPNDYVTIDDMSITYPTDCAAACYNDPDGPFLYSFFQADQPTRKRQAMSTCRCSNSPASGDYISQAATMAGECYSYQWSTYITQSSYAFSSCYGQIGTQDGAPKGVYLAPDVDTPEQCLKTCQNYEITAVQPGTPMSETQYSCTCGTVMDDFEPTNQQLCNFGSYFVYVHTAGDAVSSTFAKRQLKERLIRARNGKRALCPSGLTACKVSGSSDSFECIDVSEELESCGGCTNGEFNNPNSTLGQDCSALPGLTRGGSTCSNGQCKAFACKQGWTLSASDGTCVKQ